MPTRPPSLRAVAAFEAAARHESFAKAADELNLTHSAISHAIRSLEDRLDAHLFARVGRRVTLTREGASLANRVRASLALLTEAIERQPAVGQTRLCIGADMAIASRLLGPRLGEFAGLHPEIGLDIRSIASADALAAGTVDLVIRATAGLHLGLASREIVRERLYPVAAATFDLPDPAETLVPEMLIESQEHPWALWFAGARRKPVGGAPAMSVDTDLLAIEMAKLGVGICLAPHHLVQRELRDGVLVRLTEADVPAKSGYQADWSPLSVRRQEISVFLAWISEAFAPAAAAPRADATAIGIRKAS